MAAQGTSSSVRTLLITTSYPPEKGGIASYLGSVAACMRHAPFVLAPKAHPEGSKQVGVRRVSLEHRRAGSRAAYRLLWGLHPQVYYLRHLWAATAALARSEAVQVVLCGHVHLGLLALALRVLLKVPYVLFVHGQELSRRRPTGPRVIDSALRGAALRCAAGVVCHSGYAEQLALDWGVDHGRIVRVTPGGWSGGEASTPGACPDAGGGRRLLSVARLVPRKGVDTVIDALPLVIARIPDVRYVVAGDGPDAAHLRELAGRRGVADRVEFVGAVDDGRLAELYRACDLFVMPAREDADGEVEGLGLVFLEAASFGKPSIAGRSGGQGDAVVDGVTGLLVDPGDPAAVADAVSALLGDPSRLERMGRAAAERVRTEWTWERAAQQVDAALRRIAHGELPR